MSDADDSAGPRPTHTATAARPAAAAAPAARTGAYAALTEAGYRASVRDKATLFFTFAFPLLFLVTFGLIFSGQDVQQSGKPYINYIAPGVLSWGVGNAAVFGISFTLMQWRANDLLRLIRMAPVRLGSVIGSRYVLALVIGVIQAVLFIVVALLPGFDLSLDSRWPLALPVLLLGITAFLTIGVVVGSLADTPEAVAAIANCLMVPMAFLSGSFYPLDAMPSWIRTCSWVLPLRYFNEGVSAAVSGDGGLADIAIACGGLTAFTVLFGAVAVKMFRWSNSS